MSINRCPDCGADLGGAQAAATLLECAQCRSLFAPPGARVATLVGEVAAGQPRMLDQIPLDDAFCEKFEIGKVLGAGAVGTVYAGRERAKARMVAIKFLTAVANAVTLERFVREGEVLARITHPNVIGVHEVGRLGRYPYIVAEYLPGGPWRDRLAGGPTTLAQAGGLFIEVLAGLEACHRAGVVHRDLKPENILIGADGHARIADLGIAKIQDSAALTQAGAILGTPLYMSPEQVRGTEIDARADLYAVGMIAYEVLAGVHPFPIASLPEILGMQLDRVPDPLDRGHAVPPAVARVVDRAIAKKPGERWGSARAMAHALCQALDPMGVRHAHVAAEQEPAPAPVAEPPPPPKPAKASGPWGPGAARKVAKPVAAAPAPPFPVARAGAAVAAACVLAAGAVLFRPSAKDEMTSPVASAVAASGPAGEHSGAPPRRMPRGLPPVAVPAVAAPQGAADAVFVPSRRFRMGSTDPFAKDRPAHVVRLGAYAIDATEVTNARFDAFVKATGYVTDAEKAGLGYRCTATGYATSPGASWRHPQGPASNVDETPELPVVMVSWNDAVAYAQWAGKRLATEAEWENAARGARDGKYPWGDEPPVDRARFGRTPGSSPGPVMQFAAAPAGLFDMSGNVKEWCMDWYAADGYGRQVAEDPTGPGEGLERVVRGGSFASPADALACDVRGHLAPDRGYDDVGFRCVRSSH